MSTEMLLETLVAGQRITVEGELDEILQWRFDQLERAGFDELAALSLAIDTGIDLHVACDLLGRGCPPTLALAILL